MDENEARAGEAPETAPPTGPFGSAELQFPITFDLRIIYLVAQGATIQVDLERVFASLGVACSLMQGMSTPGGKYGRWGSRVTLQSREQMYALYAEIGKLPYVKAAI